jgi:hypothetical protein
MRTIDDQHRFIAEIQMGSDSTLRAPGLERIRGPVLCQSNNLHLPEMTPKCALEMLEIIEITHNLAVSKFVRLQSVSIIS